MQVRVFGFMADLVVTVNEVGCVSWIGGGFRGFPSVSGGYNELLFRLFEQVIT